MKLKKDSYTIFYSIIGNGFVGNGFTSNIEVTRCEGELLDVIKLNEKMQAEFRKNGKIEPDHRIIITNIINPITI